MHLQSSNITTPGKKVVIAYAAFTDLLIGTDVHWKFGLDWGWNGLDWNNFEVSGLASGLLASTALGRGCARGVAGGGKLSILPRDRTQFKISISVQQCSGEGGLGERGDSGREGRGGCQS